MDDEDLQITVVWVEMGKDCVVYMPIALFRSVTVTAYRLKKPIKGISQKNQASLHYREATINFFERKWCVCIGGERGSREGFSCDEQRGSISEIGIFNLYSDMSHLGIWHLRKAYSLQLSETLICISLAWLFLEMSSF